MLEPSGSRACDGVYASGLASANDQGQSGWGRGFGPLQEYIAAIAGVAGLTIACWFLRPFIGYGSISLIYLLGVLLAGMLLNRRPVLLVAGLSALCWNFLFIPPLFTLHIAKVEDALTFATYFIVAITVGSLTAQLKAREHLAAQVQLAHESERLRKTLLECVSHELKTPISAITAAAQGILRLIPDSGQGRMFEQLATEICHGSQRLTRVVNNLLDMNRLESGVIQPKREWCEVRELLQSAVEVERDSVNGRDVRLGIPNDLPLVLLDHTLIEQAVAKLLANAGAHTPSRLPIEVDAAYDGGELQLSVSDRGPGIPVESGDRVFEKFYRGNDRKAGGLGLGLSIARGFVEAHGGRLTVEKRDGGGARFTISLPVRITNAKEFEVT